MPAVSIVIPVYNIGKYLEKCLDSVVAQTFPDIEIIVVNDGSTDNSPEIIARYADKDSRIVVIDKSNEGLAYAALAADYRYNLFYIAVIVLTKLHILCFSLAAVLTAGRTVMCATFAHCFSSFLFLLICVPPFVILLNSDTVFPRIHDKLLY